MNRDVIISCAVTGSGDTVNKHPNIPVTPEQIANAAIEAASAGAAIAHIHVRDLNTGKGSRDDESGPPCCPPAKKEEPIDEGLMSCYFTVIY